MNFNINDNNSMNSMFGLRSKLEFINLKVSEFHDSVTTKLFEIDSENLVFVRKIKVRKHFLN